MAVKWIQSIGRWFQTRGRFSFSLWTALRRHSSQRLGPAGEKAAARYMRSLGYRIVARGHRQRLGEIDLICLDGECIVFVEVKTWRSSDVGDPSEAVDRRKQAKLTRAALIYLKKRRLLEQPARFDVVSIVWPGQPGTQPQIRHFKHAFEAIGSGQMFS